MLSDFLGPIAKIFCGAIAVATLLVFYICLNSPKCSLTLFGVLIAGAGLTVGMYELVDVYQVSKADGVTASTAAGATAIFFACESAWSFFHHREERSPLQQMVTQF
jgi:hypothetical protein